MSADADGKVERLTYDSDRLIREWRDRYAGRRTVAWQMLADAEVLVRDAIAREREQERRQATTEHAWELERRERAVELAEGWHEQQLDRLRRELAEARLKIDSMSPRQTLMREERETVEDGTVVRLLAPTVPSYGDKSSPRPWMLGELEDVAHRLRMGGADEGTEVRFKRDAIEACVPFAEFALVPARPLQNPLLPGQVVSDSGWWLPIDRRLVFAALLIVLSVIVGVVLL
jgi:YD repeat-containing protein